MQDTRFLFKTHYGTSRALVIGIDQYQRAAPLSYAVSDAQAIKQLLIDNLKFPETEVTLLTDKDATRAAIAKAFHRYANYDVQVDDRLIVFFAGHGKTQTGYRGEVGYLVPYDADPDDFSSFLRWDELTHGADLVRAKHVLFVMDACYGGLALTRSAGPGSTRFLKDMLLRTSRQVLTAGKADEKVADAGGPLPEHSVFTGHLIEGLQGKAANAEGVLTASGLMAYVYNKVANDRDSRQTPHYGHISGDGDMVLLAPGLGELEKAENKDLDRLISLPYAEPVVELEATELKVQKVKTLLASESGAIGLHDMLSSEVRRFLATTSDDSFTPSGQFTVPGLVERLGNYEAAVLDLSVLLACVAHWARPTHLATLQKCLARSSDRLEATSGNSAWMALRWYPLLIELYSCGIASVDAQRFDAMAAIFNTALPPDEDRRSANTFLETAASAVLNLNRSELPKHIPGHQRNHTPLSEYLFKVLQPKLDDAMFLGKNYESAFDQFEVLFALCAADAWVRSGKSFWAPLGRFAWKQHHDSRAPLERIVQEAKLLQQDWPPLKAGLFGGDLERFNLVSGELQKTLNKINWY